MRACAQSENPPTDNEAIGTSDAPNALVVGVFELFCQTT
jgi:hypothetical protein